MPTTNYSPNGLWTLSLSQTTGAAIAGGCFTATITFNSERHGGGSGSTVESAPALIWTDIYTIRPAATVTVTSNAPTNTTPGAIVSAGSGTLSYTAARRHPGAINTTDRVPHTFLTKSGTQTCYPSVDSSQVLQSDGADDVVCFPSGTNITTAKCTWDGKFCNPSTSGLCTPPYKAAVSGRRRSPGCADRRCRVTNAGQSWMSRAGRLCHDPRPTRGPWAFHVGTTGPAG